MGNCRRADCRPTRSAFVSWNKRREPLTPALLSCAFLRHLVAKRRFGAFQVSRVGFGFDEGISALVGEPGHFSGKVERRAVRREEHIRFQLFQLRERRFKDLDDLRELGIPDVLETRPARAAEEKYVVLFPLSRSPNSSTPCCPACAPASIPSSASRRRA